jgi:hypothetical protein
MVIGEQEIPVYVLLTYGNRLEGHTKVGLAEICGYVLGEDEV